MLRDMIYDQVSCRVMMYDDSSVPTPTRSHLIVLFFSFNFICSGHEYHRNRHTHHVMHQKDFYFTKH
jgi:hypothetical protein